MRYAPNAVYLMKNNWSDNNYKIGYSNNPTRRRQEVEENYDNVDPRIITEVWLPTTQYARKIEARWHKRFKKNLSNDHGGREWFTLTTKEIQAFLEWSEQSMNERALQDFLFRDAASKQSVYEYCYSLLDTIPHVTKKRVVETWRSPLYYHYA